MTPPRLPEVPESDATDAVAGIYEDIRRVLGLPLVNLLYRYLATRSGLLEGAWSQLRPNFMDPSTESYAAELAAFRPPTVAPIPSASLGAADFGGERAAAGAATLAAYARANTYNLLAVHALLNGVRGPDAPLAGSVAPVVAAAGTSVLPIADLDRLPAAATAILMEMSLAITGPEEPRLVPSLLRHFAHPPCLLALLWTALRPALGGGAANKHASAVAEQARVSARRLPYGVRPVEDAGVRVVLGRFVGAVSQMLVVGDLIRQALAEAAPADEQPVSQ